MPVQQAQATPPAPVQAVPHAVPVAKPYQVPATPVQAVPTQVLKMVEPPKKVVAPMATIAPAIVAPAVPVQAVPNPVPVAKPYQVPAKPVQAVPQAIPQANPYQVPSPVVQATPAPIGKIPAVVAGVVVAHKLVKDEPCKIRCSQDHVRYTEADGLPKPAFVGGLPLTFAPVPDVQLNDTKPCKHVVKKHHKHHASKLHLFKVHKHHVTKKQAEHC